MGCGMGDHGDSNPTKERSFHKTEINQLKLFYNIISSNIFVLTPNVERCRHIKVINKTQLTAAEATEQAAACCAARKTCQFISTVPSHS